MDVILLHIVESDTLGGGGARHFFFCEIATGEEISYNSTTRTQAAYAHASSREHCGFLHELPHGTLAARVRQRVYRFDAKPRARGGKILAARRPHKTKQNRDAPRR